MDTRRNILLMEGSVFDSKVPRACLSNCAEKSKRCWWCHMDIPDGKPGFGRPITHISPDKPIFRTKGRFCSLECVHASVRSVPPYERDMARNAFFIYCKETGVSLFKLGVAPSHTLREVYGGPLSDEQYIKVSKGCTDIQEFQSDHIQELSSIQYFEMLMSSTDIIPVANFAPTQVPQVKTETEEETQVAKRRKTSAIKSKSESVETKLADFSDLVTGISRGEERPRLFKSLTSFK